MFQGQLLETIRNQSKEKHLILANISQVFNRILFMSISVIVCCCTTNHLKTHCLIISWHLCSMRWKGAQLHWNPSIYSISGVDWKLRLNWNLRGPGHLFFRHSQEWPWPMNVISLCGPEGSWASYIVPRGFQNHRSVKCQRVAPFRLRTGMMLILLICLLQ